MQNGFHVKCLSGKQGVKACSFAACQQLAIMCFDIDCQCYKKHQICGASSIQSIWKLLKLKGCSFSPVLQQIIEWYDTQMKKIQIQRESVQKQIDNMEPTLIGIQNQLFYHLKQGNSDKIVPELVFNVITSLSLNKQYNVQDSLTKMKSFIQIQTKQIEEILKRLNEHKINCINVSEKLPGKNNILKFSPTLHHPNMEIVDETTIKTNDNESWKTALIEPKIENNKQCRLKIVKHNVQQFIGICQVNDFSKINFMNYLNYQKGILLLTSNSKGNYFGKTQGTQKIKDQIISISQNQIISIKCNLDTNRVIFYNETKRQTTEFNIEIDKNIPLYFCVSTDRSNNEFKILNDN